MKKTFHKLLVSVALWLCAAAPAAEPARSIEWEALRPPATIQDDPFSAMPPDQTDALREILLGRMLESKGMAPTEAALKRRLELTQQLREHGVDIDALLAKRNALMAERQAAANKGVQALDGQRVQLVGYLLPAVVQDKMVIEFLLVPWVGACSHTPPPPPNQSIRVRPARPHILRQWFEPVQISGILNLRPQQRSVFVVDGELNVQSTYAMDGAEVSAARETATR